MRAASEGWVANTGPDAFQPGVGEAGHTCEVFVPLDGDDDTDQADLGILLADWGCGVP